MESKINQKVLMDYAKIKKILEEFRKLRVINSPNKLILNVEDMRRNLRRSLVVREYTNERFSGNL